MKAQPTLFDFEDVGVDLQSDTHNRIRLNITVEAGSVGELDDAIKSRLVQILRDGMHPENCKDKQIQYPWGNSMIYFELKVDKDFKKEEYYKKLIKENEELYSFREHFREKLKEAFCLKTDDINVFFAARNRTFSKSIIYWRNLKNLSENDLNKFCAELIDTVIMEIEVNKKENENAEKETN